MNTKTCPKCNINKPLNEYHKDKRSKDGHCRVCKDCANIKSNQWRIDNHERAIQAQRDRYHADVELSRAKLRARRDNMTDEARDREKQRLRSNREKYATSHKRYIETHREDARKRAKRWYENNKEKAINFMADWANSNRDRVRAYKRNWRVKNKERINHLTMQRRIKKRGVFSSMDNTQWMWLKEQTNFRCLKCGSLDESMCRDHVIPIDPGTDTLDNMQPLCGVCNPTKGRKTIDYRPQWLRNIIKEKMRELGLEPQTDLLDREG